MIIKLKFWMPNYRAYYRAIYIKKSPFDILFFVCYISCSGLMYYVIIRLSCFDSLMH